MCLSCLRKFGKTFSAGVVDKGCADPAFAEMRSRIVPQAAGAVVEIGFGSGHNLAYYDPTRVTRVIGVEPDEAMRERAAANVGASRVPLEIVGARGEAVPVDTASADTVVLGYVLCSVEDPAACLCEAARILRPGGRILFCEHGVSERRAMRCVQKAFNGAWGLLAGGCTLLRDPVRTLADAGFRCREIEETRFSGALGLLGRHVGGWAEPVATSGRA